MHLLQGLIAAIAVMGLLSILVGGVCLLERLFPDLDILGDRETRHQERLACHVLYRRSLVRERRSVTHQPARPEPPQLEDRPMSFNEWLRQQPEPTVARRAADNLRIAADRLDRYDRNPALADGTFRIAEGDTCAFIDLSFPGVEINLTLDHENVDNPATRAMEAL